MIYHVVTAPQWELALQQGFYAAESLAVEGFIHASEEKQVEGVLERYYQNVPDLLLLQIDETKLMAELKYELAPSINAVFPHIYGRLNIDAVVKATPL